MPVIKGFSTKDPEKMKEALAYVKLPFDKKYLKSYELHGIKYDPKDIGTKVEQPIAPKEKTIKKITKKTKGGKKWNVN